MNTIAKITENEGNYLTFIYRKQQEELVLVRTTILANSFKVKPATVTEMLQKLAKKGLVEYTRYRGITLTKKGMVTAQKLLRKHRVLEVLLVGALNYDVKKACDEASKIGHHASESLINKVCQTYGHPKVCPCNKAIFHTKDCNR
ncbi:MAG: metal-dependent transcriptional regulator [Candidatus Jordarchaeaceae archaeon]